MRRNILSIFSLVLFSMTAVVAEAEAPRIAVLDFQIEAGSRAWKNLGKGLAEMLSFELGLSRDLAVVGRAERNRLLAGRSAAADNAGRVEAGKALGCRYLVAGIVAERAELIEVELGVYDASTGAVIANLKEVAAPGEYDFLTASLAGRILEKLTLPVPAAVRAKIDARRAKLARAAERFSDAVDSLDRGDGDAARTALEEAKALDPESAAIKYFISKLFVNTAKFTIIDSIYFSNTNPAFLGVIQYDQIIAAADVTTSIEENTNIADELEGRFSLAYQFPIGRDLGLEIMVMLPHLLGYTVINSGPDSGYFRRELIGAIVGLGWAPFETLAFGIGVSLYKQDDRLEAWAALPVETSEFRPAFSLGAMVRNPESTVAYDVMAGYQFAGYYLFDPVAETATSILPSLFLANNFTLALAGRSIFLILKQLNDVAFDWNYYCGRLSAGAEFWPANWLGFNLSGEGSLGYLAGQSRWAGAATAGITFRIPGTGWAGWEFGVSASYFYRPSRVVAGEISHHVLFSFSIKKAGSFIIRPEETFGLAR